MSQTTAPGWLVLEANKMLIEEATASELPLTHLCNPRRKTRRIAAARSRIAQRLRRGFVIVGRRVKIRETPDEHPVSLPMVAYCLGVDHSTIVHAVNKMKREQAKAVQTSVANYPDSHYGLE